MKHSTRKTVAVKPPFALTVISEAEALERFPTLLARVGTPMHWLCTQNTIGWETSHVGGVWMTQNTMEGWRAWLRRAGCTNPEILVASVESPALIVRAADGTHYAFRIRRLA